jgi:hypothetical protein
MNEKMKRTEDKNDGYFGGNGNLYEAVHILNKNSIVKTETEKYSKYAKNLLYLV